MSQSKGVLLDDTRSRRTEDETLPEYSETPLASGFGSPPLPWTPELVASPGLPNVNILAYLPSNASLSSDLTTVTVRDKELVTVPAALVSFLTVQAALPPRPILRIRGLIAGNIAFNLKIDMMR